MREKQTAAKRGARSTKKCTRRFRALRKQLKRGGSAMYARAGGADCVRTKALSVRRAARLAYRAFSRGQVTKRAAALLAALLRGSLGRYNSAISLSLARSLPRTRFSLRSSTAHAKIVLFHFISFYIRKIKQSRHFAKIASGYIERQQFPKYLLLFLFLLHLAMTIFFKSRLLSEMLTIVARAPN